MSRRCAHSRRFGPEPLEPRSLLSGYQLYGLDFGPYIDAGENPNYGAGQVSAEELQQRLTAIAPYTEWIRTFDCTGDLAPAGQMIHTLGKKAAVGVWIGSNASANEAGVAAVLDQAIHGKADLVIIGSEVLHRYDHGQANCVDPATLLGYITQCKAGLAAAGVSVPVTTADTYGALMNHTDVLNVCDVAFANYYPFWEGVSVDTAMAELHGAHKALAKVAGQKEIIVSEAGWPSAGLANGDAIPSPANAAYYFQNFVSWARSNGVKYFYFEAFDEPWKTSEPNGVGTHWGAFDTSQVMKPGMQAVFDGATVPNNWDSPPIIDFFNLPATTSTNLGTFVVAGTTVHRDDVVKLNGSLIAAGARNSDGVFSLPVPLPAGQNTLTLTIESAAGQVLRTATKSVSVDAGLSTAGRRLLYVDAVVGDAAAPSLDGTVVIDLDADTILGMVPGRHVRGVSPDGWEIYMDDRSVLSAATHHVLRMLPFSQSIPTNGFLVSPTGTRLYSRSEVVDVLTNTLLAPLPIDITTGSSWSNASIPGGPAISADGSTIFAGKPVVRIDTQQRTVSSTGILGSGSFLSDLAISPDGSRLLVSNYGFASIDVYDADTYQFLGSMIGVADFAGEIGFAGDGTKVVYGCAGNPRNSGGRVTLADLNSQSVVNSVLVPLADNLATSDDGNEVFASSGDMMAIAGERLGVNVFQFGEDGKLALAKTFYLGINQYALAYGRPFNDQIRRIAYKPAVAAPAPLVVAAGDWTSDGLTLSLGPDGKIHVYRSGAAVDAVAPRPPGSVSAVLVAGRDEVSDALTIDFAGGSPIPGGGVVFDGGQGGDSNSLSIADDAGNRTLTMGASQLSFGANANVAFSHVDAFSFDLGSGTLDLAGLSQTATSLTLRTGRITHGSIAGGSHTVHRGTIDADLLGDGGLTKTGDGTAVLAGDNAYQGGTRVVSGKLVLYGSTSLPEGSALTVGDYAAFLQPPPHPASPPAPVQTAAAAVAGSDWRRLTPQTVAAPATVFISPGSLTVAATDAVFASLPDADSAQTVPLSRQPAVGPGAPFGPIQETHGAALPDAAEPETARRAAASLPFVRFDYGNARRGGTWMHSHGNRDDATKKGPNAGLLDEILAMCGR